MRVKEVAIFGWIWGISIGDSAKCLSRGENRKFPIFIPHPKRHSERRFAEEFQNPDFRPILAVLGRPILLLPRLLPGCPAYLDLTQAWATRCYGQLVLNRPGWKVGPSRSQTREITEVVVGGVWFITISRRKWLDR